MYEKWCQIITEIILYKYDVFTYISEPPPVEEGKSRWPDLPDLILENIFSYLTMEEKFYASMVCMSWNRGFYLPNSWQTFILEEHVLTRRKFNYYSGWQVFILFVF